MSYQKFAVNICAVLNKVAPTFHIIWQKLSGENFRVDQRPQMVTSQFVSTVRTNVLLSNARISWPAIWPSVSRISSSNTKWAFYGSGPAVSLEHGSAVYNRIRPGSNYPHHNRNGSCLCPASCSCPEPPTTFTSSKPSCQTLASQGNSQRKSFTCERKSGTSSASAGRGGAMHFVELKNRKYQ